MFFFPLCLIHRIQVLIYWVPFLKPCKTRIFCPGVNILAKIPYFFLPLLLISSSLFSDKQQKTFISSIYPCFCRITFTENSGTMIAPGFASKEVNPPPSPSVLIALAFDPMSDNFELSLTERYYKNLMHSRSGTLCNIPHQRGCARRKNEKRLYRRNILGTLPTYFSEFPSVTSDKCSVEDHPPRGK